MWQFLLNFTRKKPIQFIVSYGILLRIVVFSLYQKVTIFPDSDGYQILADKISKLNISGYDGMRSPGFPLLLTLCNNNLLLTVFVHFVLGIITSVILYNCLLLLDFKRKSALIITLFLSSLLHVIFYETAILTEAVTLFFVLLIFNIILGDYFEKTKIKKEVTLSILIGILVLIKPFYIFFPFLIYGFSIIKKFDLKKIISQKLILFVFPLLAYFSWSYVNKINTGYFVPTTLNGFYISQNCVYFAEKTDPKFAQISSIYVKYRTKAIKENDNVSMTIWRAYDELIATTGLGFADLSNELNEFSKDAISRNPMEYLHQVFYSWIDFWRPNICWNETEFKVASSADFFIILWKIQSFILKVFKIAFVFLVPFQIFIFFKYRKITPELMLTVIIGTTSVLQAMATFGTNSRFSYPFEFMIVAIVLLQLRKLRMFQFI